MEMRVWLSSSVVVGIAIFPVGLLFHVSGPAMAPALSRPTKIAICSVIRMYGCRRTC